MHPGPAPKPTPPDPQRRTRVLGDASVFSGRLTRYSPNFDRFTQGAPFQRDPRFSSTATGRRMGYAIPRKSSRYPRPTVRTSKPRRATTRDRESAGCSQRTPTIATPSRWSRIPGHLYVPARRRSHRSETDWGSPGQPSGALGVGERVGLRPPLVAAHQRRWPPRPRLVVGSDAQCGQQVFPGHDPHEAPSGVDYRHTVDRTLAH